MYLTLIRLFQNVVSVGYPSAFNLSSSSFSFILLYNYVLSFLSCKPCSLIDFLTSVVIQNKIQKL